MLSRANKTGIFQTETRLEGTYLEKGLHVVVVVDLGAHLCEFGASLRQWFFQVTILSNNFGYVTIKRLGLLLQFFRLLLLYVQNHVQTVRTGVNLPYRQ